MPTAKITKRMVDSLQATDKIILLWDDEVSGFGIKVTVGGTRTYLFQYRMGGREAATKRWTIGRHGAWTPDAARSEARRLSQLVRSGIDPANAERERRRLSVDLALPAYVQRFIDGYLKPEWPRSWQLGARLLEREVLPALRGKSLPAVTRADITEVLDRLSDRPAARRNLFATLRRMFKWAVNRGDLASSPMSDMESPPTLESRDRVLSDEEVKSIWNAANKMGYPFGPMFRLLITTGQRRDEVAGLRWEELDRGSLTWTLPAHRTKTGVATEVSLNNLAIAELDSLAGVSAVDIQKWPRGGLVITSTGETPVSGFSKAKRRIDMLLATAAANAGSKDHEIPHWRVHDLRRTVATGLQRLGVRFEVTEAVLNHSGRAKSGVAGVYQRYDWKREKRAALEAWGAHLSNVFSREVEPASVTISAEVA